MSMSLGDRVGVTVEDGVAVIEIDNPPVNALAAGVPEALASAIERAERDPDTRAVVVIGAGRTFIAGADIKELERAAWDERAPVPDFHPLVSLVEGCSKPVVMALHGSALGGGLEVAMAGHYRVAVAEARMGLPEVALGIIPGAEGTQRLSRLVGIEKAIAMIVSGKPIGAPEALAAGLIDRIVDDDLRSGAIAFAREVIDRGGAPPRTSERRDMLGDAESNAALFAGGRETARKTRRNQQAPLAALDALQAATSLSFADGCRRERALALQCVRSDQCRALIHAFFAERGVSNVPGVPKTTPQRTVRAVAIVGAGTMGGGIAMACANAGLNVMLTDATQEALDRGLSAIRRHYETSLTRGRLSAAAVEQRLGLITSAIGLDALATADLVVEAVFENLALKEQIFAQIDRAAKADCILASNTSTLDIDRLATATRRPESVIGLHFFSPANVMRLVEIVRGRATSAEVIATAMALAKRLGKVGVVVGNGPGFVGNRMMFPYMYEAQFLVEDGATPEQVDRALTEWGMAMGIFAVDDMGGLDVAWRVRQELKQFDDPALRRPRVADRLCEMGRFGQKTGRGWYRYERDRTPVADPEVLALIETIARDAGIPRRPFGDDEIIERTIYALINEGARVLDEGIALRAADIDVIYMNGYGFPAWRGGPMFYADSVGLPTIYARVAAFHRELGDRWKPAPLLERLAADGMSFRDFDAARAPERSAAPPAAPVRPEVAMAATGRKIRAVRVASLDTIVRFGSDGSIYMRSPRPLGPYPASITERLEHWAERTPSRIFLAQRDDDGGWRTVTYREALAKVRSLAQALLDRGLSSERTVAILSGNSIEHGLLALACMHVGALYAPIATAYSLQTQEFTALTHVFDLLRPTLVLAVEGHLYARAVDVVAPSDVEIVAVSAPAGRASTPWADLMNTPATDAVDRAHAAVGPETIAKILFTSGSTGRPKGVLNTQRMLCANQEMIRSVLTFLTDEPPILCDWLPWNHTAGGNHNFGLVLHNGGTLYIDEGRPTPAGIETTVRNLREVAVTAHFGVPRSYEMLMPFLRTDPALRARFFSELKLLFYAAAGLSQRFFDELRDLAVQTCGEEILWMTGFGATETAPFALSTGSEGASAGLLGLPAPGLELKLAPVGSKLEARLRGPSITPGYWRQQPLTRAAFDEEGYYKLGDAMRFVDSAEPARGLLFDGRLAEDFKLSSGTWVSVGPLRAKILAAAEGYAQDVVIAAPDRPFVAALIFPNVPFCRDLCRDFDAGASVRAVLDHPAVRSRFQSVLDEIASRGTGSSTVVDRALLLVEPPSIDAREITDKGSINQKAVLQNRSGLVEELYAESTSPRVIHAWSATSRVPTSHQ